MKNPADVAAKWARNLSGATESIRQGVMNVTVNPAERALARQEAYLAGVQRALADGRYARGLRKVTLQSWQESMLKKGLNRVASGATEGTPKMRQFMEAWLPYEDGLKQQLQSRPRGSLQDNIARMVFAAEYNAAFRRQGG